MLGYLIYGMQIFLQPITDYSYIDPIGTRLRFQPYIFLLLWSSEVWWATIRALSGTKAPVLPPSSAKLRLSCYYSLGRGSSLRDRDIFPLWVNSRENWWHSIRISLSRSSRKLFGTTKNKANIRDCKETPSRYLYQGKTQRRTSMRSPRECPKTRRKLLCIMDYFLVLRTSISIITPTG